MPETIESFVKKLQDEGITAGKEAAEKIKNEAEREADNIIADAKARADQILAQVQDDVDRQLDRMQTELELAVRDAILKISETISRVLSAILTRKIENHLSDPDYLGQMIRDVINAYAIADAAQLTDIKINISDKMGENFNRDILKNLFQGLNEEQEKTILQTSLSKAGFEYTIDGATVEVTPDSVSELISEMVGPQLQEILDKLIDKNT